MMSMNTDTSAFRRRMKALHKKLDKIEERITRLEKRKAEQEAA